MYISSLCQNLHFLSDNILILLMHMSKNMDVFAFAVRCWNKNNDTGYCVYFMFVII